MKDPIAFQTRNPPHKGHEFQLKKSLSFSNNLVINPIFGWKKRRFQGECYRVIKSLLKK